MKDDGTSQSSLPNWTIKICPDTSTHRTSNCTSEITIDPKTRSVLLNAHCPIHTLVPIRNKNDNDNMDDGDDEPLKAFHYGGMGSRVALADVFIRAVITVASSSFSHHNDDNSGIDIEPLDYPSPISPFVVERTDVRCTKNRLRVMFRARLTPATLKHVTSTTTPTTTPLSTFTTTPASTSPTPTPPTAITKLTDTAQKSPGIKMDNNIKHYKSININEDVKIEMIEQLISNKLNIISNIVRSEIMSSVALIHLQRTIRDTILPSLNAISFLADGSILPRRGDDDDDDDDDENENDNYNVNENQNNDNFAFHSTSSGDNNNRFNNSNGICNRPLPSPPAVPLLSPKKSNHTNNNNSSGNNNKNNSSSSDMSTTLNIEMGPLITYLNVANYLVPHVRIGIPINNEKDEDNQYDKHCKSNNDNENSKVSVNGNSSKSTKTNTSANTTSTATTTMVSITGTIIHTGITLILGGAYYGKSTMVRSISSGVYDAIRGDGRELCVTVIDAVSVRAEDGRYVSNVDVSPFFLPEGKEKTVVSSSSNSSSSPSSNFDPSSFSTTRASGATSMASNVIECLEAGASALLIDEDTSASNFLSIDGRMRAIVSDLGIVPLLYRANALGNINGGNGISTGGVSIIMAVGGSGEWFDGEIYFLLVLSLLVISYRLIFHNPSNIKFSMPILLRLLLLRNNYSKHAPSR